MAGRESRRLPITLHSIEAKLSTDLDVNSSSRVMITGNAHAPVTSF
jgi:hypothetical protein